MKFYIGLQQNDWCPDQTYFAETAPGTAFFSEKGAMFLEGDWNILAELQNYPEWWASGMWPFCPSAPTRKAETVVRPSPTVCATRLLPATKIWIP